MIWKLYQLVVSSWIHTSKNHPWTNIEMNHPWFSSLIPKTTEMMWTNPHFQLFLDPFPMLFPFECRLKNGPTKSPAASPCSAAHCAGRPGATPWLSPRDLVKGGKWLGVFWFGWDRHLQFDSLNCSDILWYIYIYVYIYILYILDIIKLLDDFGTYLIYQYIGK